MEDLSYEGSAKLVVSESATSTNVKYRTFVKKRRLLQKRRSRRKQQRVQEYRRLRSMVPSLSKKPQVSKVTVIEEAISYIDQLHNALLERLKTRGLPRCMQDMNIDMDSLNLGEVKDLVCQMMSTPTTSQGSSVSVSLTESIRERNREVPSYLMRKRK
ncbi:uncharacterized protein LOC111083491 [Limulus polyphemus]|uniref:Uncharacterized protein LOC111083491 n=1 Tax=Limulus polyphemus TaxID=6850 RepID=A0ABM1RWK5_LIMPO|nr:uncharacterized protein LOC111083491 [Limulus polyphemus]